jgi:hypothetical protein
MHLVHDTIVRFLGINITSTVSLRRLNLLLQGFKDLRGRGFSTRKDYIVSHEKERRKIRIAAGDSLGFVYADVIRLGGESVTTSLYTQVS